MVKMKKQLYLLIIFEKKITYYLNKFIYILPFLEKKTYNECMGF